MSIFQKLNPSQELKNKDINQLIDFFYKMCNQISSRYKNQLLILIDSLQDMNVDKTLILASNNNYNNNNNNPSNAGVNLFLNDQISWLFREQLPPRVHLIVSIKRSSHNTFPNENASNNSININTVPLFLHYFNEKLSNETENYLFELPIQLKKTEAHEINNYITNELSRHDRKLKEDQIQDLVAKIFFSNSSMNQSMKQHSTEGNNNNITLSSASFLSSNFDEKNTVFFMNLLCKELISSNKMNNNAEALLLKNDDNYIFPTGLESFLRQKFDYLETKFNLKTLKSIFNYITAARNGITEMELIDLLSCNNEFFSHYYSNTDLPRILRFPIYQWLLIKYQLNDLLCTKFMDNKVTLCWSHDCVKKFMKQRYFSKSEQMRSCHKDLANYFLESFVETKPLVNMNRNMQIRDEEGRRYISQQPLLYSEIKYNNRRLSELWYHLMNSGI